MTQNTSHKMTCIDYQSQIEEYISGELDTATESAIASHLTTCEMCQNELHLAQAIDTVLDDLPKPTTPPDVLREITAYVQENPDNDNWLDRFVSTFVWQNPRLLILRVSAIASLIAMMIFGIHQHQKHVEIEQAKSDFNYAMSQMQYAVQKTGIAVNERIDSIKLDEVQRRAIQSTSKISSAINMSLGILNRLTGDVLNSDTIMTNTNGHSNYSNKPNLPKQGDKTQ